MQASPIFVALLVMGSAFALVMALRGRRLAQSSPVMEAALARQQQGLHGSPDLRQMKLSRPWHERVLKPVLRRLYRMGRYFTPSGSIGHLQQNLIIAGLPGGLTVTDFLGLRFLVAASVSSFAFVMFISGETTMIALLYAGGAFAVGLYAPNFWLRSKAKKRQNEILRALPDALDMMSICVDAGLGFEAAIQKVAYQWDNELALELRRVISEVRLGVARSDALRHLAERTHVPELASFVAVLIQAEKLGIAIRNVLKTQSEQMRIRRRQRAEESAHQAPVKMMIPMVLFIMPALFAIILGPAVPKIMATFQ